MNENQNFNSEPEETKRQEPEIIVNNYGDTVDPAVVVEEEDRTVLLTDKETIIIEKEPRIDVVPKNRPRKPYGGMWGSAEIATVGVAMLALLSVIILYMFFVLPAKSELEANKRKRDELEEKLASARSRDKGFTTTEERVAQLVNSVDDFEGRVLRFDSIGKPALYQRLNGLIAAYSLTNTSGPDFAPLVLNQRGSNTQQTENESGRTKYQSIFPGVYVTTTVEGSYQNLRRFIRDIETSQDLFIVISAVELEPAESDDKNRNNPQTVAQNQPNQPAGQNPAYSDPYGGGVNNPNPQMNPPQNQPAAQKTSNRGKTMGETVALRIEMAAYFKRATYQPMVIDDSNNE